MISFMILSGVKEILSRPSIRIRSPVLTSTLSLSFTEVILKVPSHFILSNLSSWMLAPATSNMVAIKRSASAWVSPRLLATALAKTDKLDLFIFLPSIIYFFLDGSNRSESEHKFRRNQLALLRERIDHHALQSFLHLKGAEIRNRHLFALFKLSNHRINHLSHQALSIFL